MHLRFQLCAHTIRLHLFAQIARAAFSVPAALLSLFARATVLQLRPSRNEKCAPRPEIRAQKTAMIFKYMFISIVEWPANHWRRQRSMHACDRFRRSAKLTCYKTLFDLSSARGALAPWLFRLACSKKNQKRCSIACVIYFVFSLPSRLPLPIGFNGNRLTVRPLLLHKLQRSPAERWRGMCSARDFVVCGDHFSRSPIAAFNLLIIFDRSTCFECKHQRVCAGTLLI